jgi:hypothetical protein
MLLSLLYRSTMQETQSGVAYFSLLVTGLQPCLLVDCAKVTRSNVTQSLAALASHMVSVPSLLNAQQPPPVRPVSDLDFVMTACLSIAQSRQYKPGVIMISECNISSSSCQVRVSLIELSVARVTSHTFVSPFPPQP